MISAQENSRFVMWLAKTLMILVYCTAQCIPQTKAVPINSETKIMQYLIQFGYLPASDAKSQAIVSEETFSDAISQFQSFMGINITGNVDVETAHLMTLPRCGVTDIVRTRPESRSKRYAIEGSRWKVRNLSYKIMKYPRRLDRRTVDREIARAFAVWSDYTDLTFTPKSGKVHIDISFERGNQGYGHPFDGPGRILAYTFFPRSGGDAYFDDSELWTVNSFEGHNLFQVAAHEFGHALGLQHSHIREALMAPIYISYQPYFRLHKDDIAGIQAIYGPKTINGPRNHHWYPRDKEYPESPRWSKWLY